MDSQLCDTKTSKNLAIIMQAKATIFLVSKYNHTMVKVNNIN